MCLYDEKISFFIISKSYSLSYDEISEKFIIRTTSNKLYDEKAYINKPAASIASPKTNSQSSRPFGAVNCTPKGRPDAVK